MGRFIDSKQVVEFAESIPKIFHKMGELKMDPPKFFILGNGEREEELAEVIKGSDFSGIWCNVIIYWISRNRFAYKLSGIIILPFCRPTLKVGGLT